MGEDEIDTDARSEKSNSNIESTKTTPSKCGGGSSRRKQLAPRFRLIRQCNECDFSTSNINEFKNHMNIEHSIEKLFPCDSCRYYCFSLYDFHSHTKSHEIKSVQSSNSSFMIQSSPSATIKTMTNFSKKILNSEEEIIDHEQPTNYIVNSSFYNHQHNNNHIEHETSTYDNEGCYDDESSEDEQGEDGQNRSSSCKKLNLSVTSSHSQSGENYLSSASTTTPATGTFGIREQFSNTPDNDERLLPTRTSTTSGNDRKRPYNVSVDPARYRRVPDPDDASSVKFACSLCGNLYKWRKSLNKHWKEKHNSESPPPLDAPVHIRPTKTASSAITTPTSSTSSSSYNKSLQGRIRPPLDINFSPTSEQLATLNNMLPQTSKSISLLGASQLSPNQPPVPHHHHPAFPFHPMASYQWLNPAWKPILAAAHQNRFPSQSLVQIPLSSDLNHFHQRNISSIQQKQNPYMSPSNKVLLPPPELSSFSDTTIVRKHNEKKQEYENDNKSNKNHKDDDQSQKSEIDVSQTPLDLTVKTGKHDPVDKKPIIANISRRQSSNEIEKEIKQEKHRKKSKKHHSRAMDNIKIDDNECDSSFEQPKRHSYSPVEHHQSTSRSPSIERLPEEQHDDHQQHTSLSDIDVSDHSRESFYDHPSRSHVKTMSSNRSNRTAVSTTDISSQQQQQRHYKRHYLSQHDCSQSPQPIDSQQSSSLLSSANNSQIDPTSPSQSLTHIPSITNPYGQKIFICSVCDQRFLAVETINEHFTQNHLPELEREISGKSPPRNTNVAQQNEEWNLSDPTNPLKCIQCDFVGRWPTELQKHAASHSSSRPFKCLICSLTYKWRWDLAKHFDRAHPKLVNPYKKRDRDQARSLMEQTKKGDDRNRRSTGTSSSPSSTTSSKKSISSRKMIPAPITKQRRSTTSQLNDNEYLNTDSVDKPEISIADSDNEEEEEDERMKLDEVDVEKENDDDERSLSPPPSKKIKDESHSHNHIPRTTSTPVTIDQSISSPSLHSSFPYMPMTSASHPVYFPPPFYTGFPHPMFSSMPFMNPSLLLQSRELQKLHSMSNLAPSSLTSNTLPTSNESLSIPHSSVSPPNLSKSRSSISNSSPFHPQQNQRQQSPSSSSSSTPSSNATTPHPENNSNSHVLAQQQHANNQFIFNQANHHRLAIAAMQAAAAAAAHQQQQQQQQQTNSNNGHMSATSGNLSQFRQRKIEKEERNFQCRWCDYRGRWRSELIQHMRCHHAQLKPYHCSACPYASNWKWDVQKHVKKQHPQDQAKIIEIPDKFLFRTTGTNLKQNSNHKNVTDETDQQQPQNDDADYSYFGLDVQQKLTTMKCTADRQLSCQQCPFAANSMAELRRHLIVHSSEQPYHCFNCDYRSKWKCDVKKHMRVCGHHGPVLVGRKAMQKVMESLGLVIGNTDKQHQAAAAAAAAVMMRLEMNKQRQHPDLMEQEENIEYAASEDEEDDDLIMDDRTKREWGEIDSNVASPPSVTNTNTLTISEEKEELTTTPPVILNNQRKNHMKLSSNSQTISNSNLRCRQCEYEADDLSDLLVHRKAHASMKNGTKSNTTINIADILPYHHNTNNNNTSSILSNNTIPINNDVSNEQSDIDEENSNLSDDSVNDDNQLTEQTTDYLSQSSQFKPNYQMYAEALLWLENNPAIKDMTKINHNKYSIEYKCKKCNFLIMNDRDLFLKHLDSHEVQGAFVYDLCDFSNSDINKVKYHLNNHHRTSKNGKCS
ncbi:unnamed protein product [Didymodactylos carnosus]|uniref:C2H2-type domain-containing protein n=1 Tax=Didymodactylos carnosus TaxID=1234261 RepID=A0A8S2GL00_9BILA|nr:unnamed protein product [Didymodactylos carnosus]CAF3533056.1 unnamed protein product [Didymodactylos carnosus]